MFVAADAGHAVALRKGGECGAQGQNHENCSFFHRSSSLVKGVKKAAACFGGILRPDTSYFLLWKTLAVFVIPFHVVGRF